MSFESDSKTAPTPPLSGKPTPAEGARSYPTARSLSEIEKKAAEIAQRLKEAPEPTPPQPEPATPTTPPTTPIYLMFLVIKAFKLFINFIFLLGEKDQDEIRKRLKNIRDTYRETFESQTGLSAWFFRSKTISDNESGLVREKRLSLTGIDKKAARLANLSRKGTAQTKKLEEGSVSQKTTKPVAKSDEQKFDSKRLDPPSEGWSPREKDLYRKILEFDFDSDWTVPTFAGRLAKANGWSLEYANQVIFEYRRFLFLSVAADHPASPSASVDQAWHLHHSDTDSYERLCRDVLGQQFRRHQSTCGEADIETTLLRYRNYFGREPPSVIWLNWLSRRSSEHSGSRIEPTALSKISTLAVEAFRNEINPPNVESRYRTCPACGRWTVIFRTSAAMTCQFCGFSMWKKDGGVWN